MPAPRNRLDNVGSLRAQPGYSTILLESGLVFLTPAQAADFKNYLNTGDSETAAVFAGLLNEDGKVRTDALEAVLGTFASKNVEEPLELPEVGDLGTPVSGALRIGVQTVESATVLVVKDYLGTESPLATQQFVMAQIAALSDSAPTTLDTLNELANALGDDPNFAASTATALGFRLRVDAVQSLSGPQKTQALDNLGGSTLGKSIFSVANSSDFRDLVGLAINTNVQAYNGNLQVIAAQVVNGFYVKTGAGSVRAGAITPGSGVLVTNGNGVAGDPVIAADFASQAEAEAASSAGKVMSPAGVKQFVQLFLRSRIRVIELSPAGWVFTTNTPAQSASRGTDRNIIDLVTGATTGTWANVRNNGGGTNSDLVFGGQYNQVNWSLGMAFSFNISVQGAASGSPSSKVQVQFGAIHNTETVTDFTNKGIALVVENTAVSVQVHTGSALNNHATGFSITSGSTPTLYPFSLVVDGVGGWALYSDATLIFAGTGAPTGTTANNACSIAVGVSNGSTTSSVRVMVSDMSVMRTN